MKILVLQLARLGDIYLTWPTVNAIRRQWPEAEIHYLVRERFAAAAEGLNSVDKVIGLDTAEILKWVVDGSVNIDRCMLELEKFVADLRAEAYTNVLNFTYSPFSSYLTKSIAQENTQVFGYTRFEDGFLSIPDDASAYFYAQVGTGRQNRAHLADVFASVAGVDLTAEDWACESVASAIPQPQGDYIVVQPGASESHKMLEPEVWSKILRGIYEKTQKKIILVGAPSEVEFGKSILLGLDGLDVQSWIGKTKMTDLFSLLSGAQLFLGCDSVGVHIASMTNTLTVNLSFASVNFWETGPRAKNSRVLWAPNPGTMAITRVVEEVTSALEGRVTGAPCIFRQDDLYEGYRLEGYPKDDFAWKLIRAIYMGEEFPVPEEKMIFESMDRIYELAQLACEQIEKVRDLDTAPSGLDYLNQADTLLSTVEKICPQVAPLIRWFMTEKLRVPPGSFESVTNKTYDIYCQLRTVSGLYVVNDETLEESINHDNK